MFRGLVAEFEIRSVRNLEFLVVADLREYGKGTTVARGISCVKLDTS